MTLKAKVARLEKRAAQRADPTSAPTYEVWWAQMDETVIGPGGQRMTQAEFDARARDPGTQIIRVEWVEKGMMPSLFDDPDDDPRSWGVTIH